MYSYRSVLNGIFMVVLFIIYNYDKECIYNGFKVMK